MRKIETEIKQLDDVFMNAIVKITIRILGYTALFGLVFLTVLTVVGLFEDSMKIFLSM